MSEITRRELLKGLVAAGAVAGLDSCVTSPGDSLARRDSTLIRRENQEPGTRDWILQNTRIDPATKYRCPWIEGYCSKTSVRPGEEIQFFVSTNPASSFTLDLYRMGYY